MFPLTTVVLNPLKGQPIGRLLVVDQVKGLPLAVPVTKLVGPVMGSQLPLFGLVLTYQNWARQEPQIVIGHLA